MVCLGNICRSPIAEAVLRSQLIEARVDDVDVASAGTGGWHAGARVDPRATAALARQGLRLDHRAQQFPREWFDRADVILAMDADNLHHLRRLAPAAVARTRIRLLRSFDPSLAGLPETDSRLWVADPFYGSDTEFDRTVAEVLAAVAGLVDHLRRP